jgi:ribosome recycling factor
MQTATQVKQAMQQALASLEADLLTLRPGRASADLVGSLPVSAYGNHMPLNQLASISSNEQGQLLVQPWDKAVMGAVESAIRDSQLGFSVINEGSQLRLTLPPLSQERRQEFVKILHQKGEAARIRLRQIRGDAHQAATKAKSSGEIREDDFNRFIKDLNGLVDEFNQKVKELVDKKEKELLTV